MFLRALCPVGCRETLCVWVHTGMHTCACVYVMEIRKKRVHSSWWRSFPPAGIPVTLYLPVEKSSDMNRVSVSTYMDLYKRCKYVQFINKCKTHNSGKPLFKKERLRYIHSPVVDKKETVPCDPLTGTFWRLCRKSHCSVEQLQRWEDWWRVEGNCNRDRQRKAENRTFYHVSCSMCFPGVYLMSSPITITTGISQCYASSLRGSFFNWKYICYKCLEFEHNQQQVITLHYRRSFIQFVSQTSTSSRIKRKHMFEEWLSKEERRRPWKRVCIFLIENLLARL